MAGQGRRWPGEAGAAATGRSDGPDPWQDRSAAAARQIRCGGRAEWADRQYQSRSAAGQISGSGGAGQTGGRVEQAASVDQRSTASRRVAAAQSRGSAGSRQRQCTVAEQGRPAAVQDRPRRVATATGERRRSSGELSSGRSAASRPRRVAAVQDRDGGSARSRSRADRRRRRVDRVGSRRRQESGGDPPAKVG